MKPWDILSVPRLCFCPASPNAFIRRLIYDLSMRWPSWCLKTTCQRTTNFLPTVSTQISSSLDSNVSFWLVWLSFERYIDSSLCADLAQSLDDILSNFAFGVGEVCCVGDGCRVYSTVSDYCAVWVATRNCVQKCFCSNEHASVVSD